MHQVKNGLAFIEVLLARKIYFGEIGFLPSSGATNSGGSDPSSPSKNR
jgi:hypothetical protein